MSSISSTPKQQAYFLSLGRMLHHFAMCEWTIKGLLRTQCGVSVEVSRAVFSGTNLDQAIKNMHRLYRSHGSATPPGLKATFDQLKLIADERNLILHYGAADETAEGFLAAKLWLELPDVEDEKSRIFTPQMLDAMTDDLAEIDRVMMHFKLPAEYVKQMSSEARREGEQPVSWRYKPPSAPKKSKPPPRTNARDTRPSRRTTSRS